jgi:hypothetical protein
MEHEMPRKKKPKSKATENRVLSDLTPETFQAIEAYAEASLIREFTRSAQIESELMNDEK